MPKQEYHDIITHLDAVEAQDEVSRAHLARLKDDLRRAMEDDAEDDAPHDTLRERLADAAVHFEAEFPDFAQVLRNFIDFLSQSGV